MKKQSKIVSSICIGVFLMIFTFSIMQANKNQNTVQVSSSTALISVSYSLAFCSAFT